MCLQKFDPIVFFHSKGFENSVSSALIHVASYPTIIRQLALCDFPTSSSLELRRFALFGGVLGKRPSELGDWRVDIVTSNTFLMIRRTEAASSAADGDFLARRAESINDGRKPNTKFE